MLAFKIVPYFKDKTKCFRTLLPQCMLHVLVSVFTRVCGSPRRAWKALMAPSPALPASVTVGGEVL